MAKPKQIPKHEPQTYYEVDKLLNKRIVNDKAEYLVKWKGYSDEEATWQKAQNLQSILDVILEYENGAQQIDSSKPSKSTAVLKNSDAQLLQKTNSHLQDVKDSLQRIDEVFQSSEQSKIIVSKSEESMHLSSEEQKANQKTRKNGSKINIAKNSQIYENDSMDLSFQAKKISSKFAKIAEKCKMTPKPSKKEQKEQKKQRKEIEEKHTPSKYTPPKRRYKKSIKLAPQTQLLQPHQQKQAENESKLIPKQNKICAQQRKTRSKKSQPVSQIIVPSELLQNDKKMAKQHEQPKVDSKDSISETTLQNQPNEGIHKIIQNNYHQAFKISEEKKGQSIIDIRKIESLPNELGEYMVEYGSGLLKRFKIIEVMMSHPLEFANYLEKRHKI